MAWAGLPLRRARASPAYYGDVLDGLVADERADRRVPVARDATR